MKAEAEAMIVEQCAMRSPMSNDVLWTATGPISNEGRRCALESGLRLD